jgi:hypothetical protein
MNRPRLIIGCMMLMVAHLADAATLRTILAGGETDLPADTPGGRLDGAGLFPFVGALEIAGGGGSFKGTAVAISPDWLLTAGHNADLNDDGLPDSFWNSTFHLPEYGSFAVLGAFTHGSFTGFANPSVAFWVRGYVVISPNFRHLTRDA